MCIMCTLLGKNTHIEATNQTKDEKFYDYLIREKAHLLSRVDSIDILLDKMNYNPSINEFLDAAETLVKEVNKQD